MQKSNSRGFWKTNFWFYEKKLGCMELDRGNIWGKVGTIYDQIIRQETSVVDTTMLNVKWKILIPNKVSVLCGN